MEVFNAHAVNRGSPHTERAVSAWRGVRDQSQSQEHTPPAGRSPDGGSVRGPNAERGSEEEYRRRVQRSELGRGPAEYESDDYEVAYVQRGQRWGSGVVTGSPKFVQWKRYW